MGLVLSGCQPGSDSYILYMLLILLFAVLLVGLMRKSESGMYILSNSTMSVLIRQVKGRSDQPVALNVGLFGYEHGALCLLFFASFSLHLTCRKPL